MSSQALEIGSIDYLVSSSNKCIESIPGFSFIVARKQALSKCVGNSRTLSLDIHAQCKGLDTNGKYLFSLFFVLLESDCSTNLIRDDTCKLSY